MSSSLVSIIVPTFNSSKTLYDCLDSILHQSYKNIELIVVDNNSVDDTKRIAFEFTDKVFHIGPERSAQRNYGVSCSKGSYVFIIDSDMKLSGDVVNSCVDKINENSSIVSVIVPEESFGEGFWARCKKLERSFYIGIPWMEAARFFKRSVYLEVGGYNECMVSGEDWDLSQRVSDLGKIASIKDLIYHNEGNPTLVRIVSKKVYYAKKFSNYASENRENINLGMQVSISSRYKLFLSEPKKLFKNPLVGIGMLLMKTCEFIAGGVSFILAKL